MTQATTGRPRAAEMPETVLIPTICDFLHKFAKKSSERQNFVKKYKEKKSKNSPFLSDMFQLFRKLLDKRKSVASLIGGAHLWRQQQ